MKICFGAILLCLAASQALADEKVLYCTDTTALGIKWDDTGNASPARFLSNRYSIKIISSSERVITELAGGSADVPERFECKRSHHQVISCSDESGLEAWAFSDNKYTRAFLYGTPVGGDPNIVVAYGVCTAF
jgi:hypothetical protein